MTTLAAKKTVLRLSFLAPLMADGKIDLPAGVAAIILRNAGTATVNFENGLYTLDSKETVSFNVTEENATLLIRELAVTFDTSTGEVKKLQISLLKASNDC